MKRFVVLVLLLLLPVYSWAAYKIYLNNGSVISGVASYEERGDELNIYFDTGSMTIPRKDVRKIEGKESPETAVEETPDASEQKREGPRETPAPAAPAAPEVDKRPEAGALQTELDAVNSDIRATEDEEARLVAAMNEKTGSRSRYNVIQLKQLEKELEPLKQELGALRQKKTELIKKRSGLESELKSTQ